MLLLARQFEDANSRAEKALEIDPKNVEALILHANALAGLNKFEDALNEVEAAIREEPDRTASYTILGAMQMVHGDRQEAETAFRKAVETDPKSVDARLALVNYFWAVGRRSDAEAQLKEALTIDPKNVLANRALALFYLGARQPKEAEPYLKTLAETLPDGTGKLLLADYYISLQRRDEAQRILEAVAASGVKGASSAKLRLAGLGLGSGDPAAAMKLIDDVLAKEPHNWEALLAKGQTLLGLGKVGEAFAAVQSAAQTNPQSSETQFALGRMYVLRGQRQEADAAFTQALKLNPRMAIAEYELAKLHFAANQLDQAEQFARAAVLKVNGYVAPHLLLARIYLMRGETAKAEPIIRGVAKYLPALACGPGRARSARALEAEQSRRSRRVPESAGRRIRRRPTPSPDSWRWTFRTSGPTPPRPGWTRPFGVLRKTAGILLLAARSYAALGDLASTERFARRAIDVNPSNLDAYSLLGSRLHPAASGGRRDSPVHEGRGKAAEVHSGAHDHRHAAADAEQAGRSARAIREGAGRRPTRRGCRQQPGRNLHGNRRQSGYRAAAREDREGRAAGSTRDQRHAGMGLLQEGPVLPGGHPAARIHQEEPEESDVPVPSRPGRTRR